MEVLIVFFALLALWAFIRHDQNAIKNSDPPPLSRETMQGGFTPGASIAWRAQAGVSMIAFIASASQFITPSLPPFTGKWSAVQGAIHSAIGIYGLAFFWAACAVLLAFGAYRKYKASQRR